MSETVLSSGTISNSSFKNKLKLHPNSLYTLITHIYTTFSNFFITDLPLCNTLFLHQQQLTTVTFWHWDDLSPMNPPSLSDICGGVLFFTFLSLHRSFQGHSNMTFNLCVFHVSLLISFKVKCKGRHQALNFEY